VPVRPVLERKVAHAVETKGNGQAPARRGLRLPLRTNIAGTVDVRQLAEYASGLPGVVLSREYKYMCSDPGQAMIQSDIREERLERVVVASCSPCLHENTFRHATADGA